MLELIAVSNIRLFFIGDIVGSSGRKALKALLPDLKKELQPTIIIANSENAAHGFGLTTSTANEIFESGVDVLTGGNHTWDKKEVISLMKERPHQIVRPANYPADCPGTGSIVVAVGDKKLGIINLMGRVFMDPLDCPFRAFDREYEKIKSECDMIFVDLHAETTSEKSAMGYYIDGRASALVGTHTHVQTADERILNSGTGFLTDAGMTGPYDSVIGMKKEVIIQRFLAKMPVRMEVADGPAMLQGVVFELDASNGKCVAIERVRKLHEVSN